MGAEEITPDLDEFLTAYRHNPQVWDLLSSAHHQNLFEAAIERIEALQAALRSRRDNAR